MNRKTASLLGLLPLALLFTSCSGLPVQNCPSNNCNQTGNANVTLTLFDAAPANADFVNFNVPISAITLTPQTGADISIFSPATPTIFEITNLQSDSTLIGTFQIPAGSYTSINFLVGAAFAVFANSSTSAIGNCNPLSVCHLASGAPGQITVTFTPALSVAGNQNAAVGVEFNLNNAITSQNGITIDLKQPNVITIVSLPRTGQASGTVDTVEDFVGVVKTISGSTLTLQNDAGTTFTGTIGASTTFNPPPGGSSACGGVFDQACVAVGQTLSVDANVSVSGAISITNIGFLDLPAIDEIEGTIFPTTTQGTFIMAVDHKILAANSTNSTILGPVGSGTTLNLILDTSGGSGSVGFLIDTNKLPISSSLGFLDFTDLITGQRIMAHVKSVTSGTLLNVTTDRLVLRFSRITGTVGTISSSIFALQTTPPYLGLLAPPQVQTFVPQTIFDGVSDITGLNGVTTPVSIRALYLNPAKTSLPFLAAKVRKH
jgi:uncharacterized protein DUF4382